MFYEPLIINETPYFVYTGQCRPYPQHWHSELELHICLQGTMVVALEDQQITLSPGEALIIPGYAAHAIPKADAQIQRITIMFGYALLGNEYKSIQNVLLHVPIQSPQTPEKLRRALDGIIDCLSDSGSVHADNEWQLRSCLYLLAAQLRSYRAATPSEELQSRIQRLDSIYTVLDYVAQHYPEKLSVEHAAKLAGYAKTYFCRQFKQITGVSFHRYLNNYRISKACLLLEDPNLAVSEVAAMTGFSSAKLFCRTFKEVTGLTTSQYQKLPPDEKSTHWMQ